MTLATRSKTVTAGSGCPGHGNFARLLRRGRLATLGLGLILATRPAGASMSCGTPCSTDPVAQVSPYYEVFVDCADGSYTAGTGPAHSATIAGSGRQSTLYGGNTPSAWSSDIALQVHDTGATFENPTGGVACAFNPPDTAGEPNNLGVEAEFSIAALPGVTLVWREEIVAFGSTEANSGVRLTQAVTNPVTSIGTVNLGVRWQLDYKNATDDGPAVATVSCPFQLGPIITTEYEFGPSEITAGYRIQNDTGTPVFSTWTNTEAVPGFPGTGRPDRLVFGLWSPMEGSVWNYVPTIGADASSDAAMLYYFGYLPADGIRLSPGESFSRSVVIFTSSPCGCQAAPALVGQLKATKQTGGLQNVVLGWTPDAAATAYNAWYVVDKQFIDMARSGVPSPPTYPVTGCVPSLSNSCTDLGAVPRTPTLFHYQIRGVCGGAEGP